jgi:SmpA / OmlA family
MSLIDYMEWCEMRKNLAAAAALLLAGCVSMGTNFDVAAVDRLQVGMTKAQVISLLGQPNQVVTNADGSERLIWVHSTGSMFGANARSVGLPFGPDGRLRARLCRSSARTAGTA